MPSPEARVTVRVQPGAPRPDIVGWLDDGSLKLRVPEPPEGGRANRAVERLLRERLNLPAGSVSVVRGAAGRLKTVAIRGLDDTAVRSRIGRREAEGGRGR